MAAPIITFGDVDEGTMAQAVACSETGPVARVVLLADNHKGYGVPIGGVVAYREAISPSGVGFDIACGVKAVKTNLRVDTIVSPGDDLRPDFLRALKDNIAFGIGRESKLDKSAVGIMDDPRWQDVPREILQMKRKAEQQLGSVGSGNHYIDLLVDDEGVLWVACHFGSRGFGHGVAKHFLKRLNAPDAMDTPPAVIEFEKDPRMFAEYLVSMGLAGDYAYAGRDLVMAKTLEILGAKPQDTIHNHHNFAWSERHDGEYLWVVRKGATPASLGERGFVGGSMGDIAVVVRGEATETAAKTLRSTVHGAGRLMSRTKAAGKRNRRTGELLKPGLIRQEDHDAHMAEWNVVTLGGELDESPFAYKKLEPVLAAQGDSITVETRLRPIAVAMAAADDVDPYRD